MSVFTLPKLKVLELGDCYQWDVEVIKIVLHDHGIVCYQYVTMLPMEPRGIMIVLHTHVIVGYKYVTLLPMEPRGN